MDTVRKYKKRHGLYMIISALAVCLVLTMWHFAGEKQRHTIRPGDYRAQEILYSTIEAIPEGEIVRDLFVCSVKEDGRLLIQQLYQNGDSSQWICLGKLEPCGLSNEHLKELIRLPNTWLSGSPEEIGVVSDAWFVTRDKSGGSYLLFCTEDGEDYFAKCSEMGENRVTYISYLAKLDRAER